MKQVKSLRQLCSLALRRKSVICPNSPCFNKSIPAGFMCNLQGWIINRLIVSGMYVYVPKKKTSMWDSIVRIPITREKFLQSQRNLNEAWRKFEENTPIAKRKGKVK